MKADNLTSALLLSTALASSAAIAGASGPTTIVCGPKAIAGTLSLSVDAVTSLGEGGQPTCPLLEDNELRKLVEKFGAGTMFAHPAILGTCLSGTVTAGTLTFGSTTIDVDTSASYSESAQRLFPVPSAQGGVSLFAESDDQTLQVGAAMTAVHLEGQGSDAQMYAFDLLTDDHFLVSMWTGEDTEDFLIVGSKGPRSVSGRLTGRGQIVPPTAPNSPLQISFEINGAVCLQ